jgi:hypothetical protein
VHDPTLLPLLADRVIGLRGGQLAFDVAADELDTAHLRDLYDGRQDGSSQYSTMALGPPSAAAHEPQTTVLMPTPHERPFLA